MIVQKSSNFLVLLVVSLLFVNGCGADAIRNTPAVATPTSTSIETPIPTPTPPSVVSITSPIDGADIPHTITVSGEYQGVPEDRQLWLYVYATYIQKYFLQPIDRLNNGTWQARNVIVGDPDEQGTRYKLGVISVDQPDNERLETNSFQLDQLPPSAESLVEVTVYRK